MTSWALQLGPGPTGLPAEVLPDWQDEERAAEGFPVLEVADHSDCALELVHVVLVPAHDGLAVHGEARDGAHDAHDARALGGLEGRLGHWCCKKGQLPSPRRRAKDMRYWHPLPRFLALYSWLQLA